MNGLRIHIGHHFYGAGNAGDDLMMAGFINFLKSQDMDFSLTCPIPFAHASQQLRFPEVEWLAYTPEERMRSISECHVWLGLGDTPFQTNVGPWFLAHLLDEMRACQSQNKQMYFLGVGVNNVEAIQHPFARPVVNYASHIWTRDQQSAGLLCTISDPGKITKGSDLANIYLKEHAFTGIEAGVLAFVQNYEYSQAFSADALLRAVRAMPEKDLVWMVQEVREEEGSERDLFTHLVPECQQCLQIRMPDYAHSSTAGLIDAWGAPETVITTRYHAALTSMWMGGGTVILRRSEKLAGLASQMDVVMLDSLVDTEALMTAVANTRPVGRDQLDGMESLASRSCQEFIEASLS